MFVDRVNRIGLTVLAAAVLGLIGCSNQPQNDVVPVVDLGSEPTSAAEPVPSGTPLAVQLGCEPFTASHRLCGDGWGDFDMPVSEHATVIVAIPQDFDPAARTLFVDAGGPLRVRDVTLAAMELVADTWPRRVLVGFVDQDLAETQTCIDAVSEYHRAIDAATATENGSVLVAEECDLASRSRGYFEREAKLVSDVLGSLAASTIDGEQQISADYDVVGSSFAAARWFAVTGLIETDDRPTAVAVASPFAYGTDTKLLAEGIGEESTLFWEAVVDGRCVPDSCAYLEIAGGVCSSACDIAHLATETDLSERQVALGLMGASWDARGNSAALAATLDGDRIEALTDAITRLGAATLRLNVLGEVEQSWPEHLVGICAATRNRTGAAITENAIGSVVAELYAPCHYTDPAQMIVDRTPFSPKLRWCFLIPRPDPVLGRGNEYVAEGRAVVEPDFISGLTERARTVSLPPIVNHGSIPTAIAALKSCS